MQRLTLIVAGLTLVVVGSLLTASSVGAADPPPLIVPRPLVSQRVELLPQGPLCWNISNERGLTPGTRLPSSDYRAVSARLY